MPTKVIEVKQKYEKLHPSVVLYKKAEKKAHNSFHGSSGVIYAAAVDAREAAAKEWKKAGSPPLEPVRIELSIPIQNVIDKMEPTGCEFMNMVLKEKGDGAYLFFKCPAGGAGGAGSARTRSNRKSRRSRTRKN